MCASASLSPVMSIARIARCVSVWMDGMSLQSTCVRSAPTTSPSSFMRKPSTLTMFMASGSSQMRVRIVAELFAISSKLAI